MTLFQKAPRIVYKPLPYEADMLKVLLILGIVVIIWNIFEEE